MARSLHIDQVGRSLELGSPPKRIISLVPSITELLVDLGLEDELIGITKFCVHPPRLKDQKAIIGGTKNLKIDKIRALQPDLIIANKEENIAEQVERLAQDYPVWVSNVSTLEQATEMILMISDLCRRKQRGLNMVNDIHQGLEQLSAMGGPKLKIAYLIWKNPYMSCGRDTYIHSVLEKAHFENVFRHTQRYPTTDIEEIEALQPDCIFLSSEPFPFGPKHVLEIQKKISSKIKVIQVSGEIFSWYGSYMLKIPAYLEKLKKEIAHS